MSVPGVTPAVRREVLSSCDRFWRPADFSAISSPDAVTQALSRLMRAGELRRVRRGLYWRGSPTILGMAPPPPILLVKELAGDHIEGSGPAGVSAALALHLSTQVPRFETVAIPARAPRSEGFLRFVSRAAASRRRSEGLWPAEVALLEVLRDWDALVEVPAEESTSRVAGLAGSGGIRPDRVARAAATEPPGVRERLRHLLGDIGMAGIAATVPPARSRRAMAG